MRRPTFNDLSRAALIIGLSLFLVQSRAIAANYFVDAELGDDGFDGLAAAPGTSHAGPWRSLRRLESAQFAPGDQVKLRCGQRWTEGLRIFQSGSSGNPIVLGSYPLPCDTPPAIDGRVLVPADNWTQLKGNVYQASLPLNIVRNGSLRQSATSWTQPTSPRGTLAFKRRCASQVSGCLHFTAPKKGTGTLASPRFSLRRGERYRVTYRVFAPKGNKVTSRLQRASTAAPQQLGPNQRITGTGRWQTKAFNFTARGSAFDARLTFAVAGARSPLPHLQLRDVAVQPLIENPIFLMLSGRILQPAHHPNFGHDPDAPLSVYLRNAQDSDSELGGDSGSSFVTMGSDLVLPPGASVTPGLTIRLRTENWNLDQRAIAAVNGNRIDLSSPSTHQMRADWGYFLLGAEWMVDGPDEWFFNGDTRSLRVFMPDGAAPGNRVMLSNVLIGIDLHGLHDVVVEDLDIRGVTTGLLLDNSRDVIVRRVGVTDTRGRGISLAGARDVEIESTVIRRTGLDAINACVSGAAGCGASNIARNNRIEDSGVLLVDGKVVSLPAPQDGAIALGPDGTETGNRIARSGLRGIFLRGAHTVTRNAIVDACLVLDDCGGIYGGGPANGSNISGNVIVRVHGNTIGTPIPNTRTAGVYVDELGTDMLVEDNVVMGADRGIQVHNAFSNVFRNNLLYGNRRNQLWLQEDTNILRSNGDLHTNVFDGNVLVALEDTAALRSETDLVDVHDFGSFTGNIYSTLFGRTIVTEAVQNNEVNLDFPAWQDATANGVPRNSDATGRSIALQGFAAFQVTGDNLVPNGDLDTGLTGWATFSSANPSAQLTLAACATTCAHVSAGGGTTLLSTPYFSVKEDQWYRVSFDAATDDPDREITVLPRRGGGGTAGFEPLGPTARTFPGSTTMKRYSFTFRAAISVTANDPVTGERGARIDFLGLQPGQGLTVSNVEMVPIGTRDIAMATALLVNDDPQIAVDVPCPDESSAPLNCGAYVKMLDGTPVNFPLHLEPLQAEAVYTRDSSLVDTDSDGIPDEQDQCSLSPPSEAVNAAGCALDQ